MLKTESAPLWKSALASLFGFSRKRRKTALGAALRHLNRAVVVLAILYAALYSYPQVLFAHSFRQGDVTVYAREALTPEVADRIEEISNLVRRSELAKEDQNHRVFVCNEAWLFRLFSPRHARSFAVTARLTDNIFIADADLTSNIVRSRRASFNHRSFSGVVAHEITHVMIRRHLGILGELTTKGWVKEGYSDYVAQESSFPEKRGLELLRSGRTDPSKSFQYFVWRKMVEHLIERRGATFLDLATIQREQEAVMAETVAALAAKSTG